MPADRQQFMNTYISNLTMDEAVGRIKTFISANKKSYVVAVNVDVIVKIEKDTLLKEAIDHADMVLIDGKPLIWISNFYKHPVKEKISGSDFVPKICSLASENGFSIFILGGGEGIAEQAKRNLEKEFPQIKVVGVHSPSFGFEKNQKEVDRVNSIISEAHPDILIACLGCPKQEKFIYQNIDKNNAKISICAGATVDFLAGNVKRAPKWMSNHGLEWFYRFLQEPKRMFRRYFIDDPQILKLIWKYRKINT